MKGEPSSSNVVDILSFPWEDFDMIDLITYSISLVSKDLSVIFLRVFLKVCDKN